MSRSYQHANFFSTVGTICCVIGFEGSFRQFNEATVKVFGYSSDELEGRSFLEMVHPDERASIDNILQQLSEHDEPLAFTNRMLHHDGSYHQYMWQATPSLMEFGFYGIAIPATICLAQTRDELDRYREDNVIMREKIADLELMLEEQQSCVSATTSVSVSEEEVVVDEEDFDLYAVINYLNEGVIICDTAQKLFMLNARRVMSILGMRITLATFESLWQQGLQAESPFQPVHYTFRTVGNKPKRLTLYSTTLYADDGKTPTSRVVVIADITEQHIMKHHLRGLQEDMNLLTHAQTQGLLDWHIQENRAHYSASWENLLGLGTGEAGKNIKGWHSRVHPGDFPQLQSKLNKFFTGHYDHFEILHRLQHNNGTYRWIEVKGEIQRNEREQAKRLIATFIDISEQKQLEDALQAAESAEKALRNERMLCETVFQHAPLMIFYQDNQHRIIRSNQYTEQWFSEHQQSTPIQGPFPLQSESVLKNGKPVLGLHEPLENSIFSTYKIPFQDAQGTLLGIVIFAFEIFT